jgi:hypothetical protein
VFEGRFTVGNELEALTSEEIAMLEALGYVHDGGSEPGVPAAQGPAPCL